MATAKIIWTKTDIAYIADLNGNYRKLNAALSEAEKEKCNWKEGIGGFNYYNASYIIKCLFPFLNDEQIITLLYKQKTISQIL